MKNLILFLIIMISCFCVTKAQTTFDHVFGIFGQDKGEGGEDVLQLNDCNYIVLGNSFDGKTFLRKMDEFGTQIWTRQFEFTNILHDYYGRSIIQTADNGFLIAGNFHLTGGSTSNLTIQKVDENGICIWSKKYNNSYAISETTIIQTQDGNYVIAGYTSNNDAYITKIAPNGNWLWSKSYSATDFDVGGITELNSSNLALAGRYYQTGQSGFYVLVTDAVGSPLCENYFSDNVESVTAIIQTNDGGLAITGKRAAGITRRGFLLKTDACASFLWGKEYLHPVSDLYGEDLLQNTDDSYMITGTARFPNEITLFKTDVSGNFLWGKNYASTLLNGKTQIIKTQDGGYAIAGLQDGYGFMFALKNNQNKALPVPTRDNMRLIKTDGNGNVGGCEIPITYTQNNYAPIQATFASTVNSVIVTPQNISINCTTPTLNEDVSCVTGVPICNNTGIDLSETYSCKVDLTNDDPFNDRAFDQVLLPNGNRMITGLSYSNSNLPNIFLKELDALGNLVRLNAYPIQGTISNVEMVYDEDANEFVLFYDANFGGSIDIYILRVNASNLAPILKHGPLMSNSPDPFSWEYAIEILYEPPSINYPSGSYVLLVNRQIPVIRKSYIVTIDKSNFNATLIEELEINGTSENIKAYDLIKNPITTSSVWGCYYPEYVITGSYNNDAFITNYCAQGLITTTFDIDNDPSTSDIGKKIIAAGNNYYIAGDITYGQPIITNGNTWLAEVSLVASPSGHLLNGASIYDQNSNEPETILDLDYKGGYLYLTGKYNIGIVSPTGIDPHLNYTSKVDLNRNRIWDMRYPDAYNQGSMEITNIEVDNGAINSIGHLIYEAVPAPPGGSLEYDIYVNKTDLNGEVSNPECFSAINFNNISTNPTVVLYYDAVNTSSTNIFSTSMNYVTLGFRKECCSEPMIPTNPANCLVFDRSSFSLATASPSILNGINTQNFTFEAWISGNESDQDGYPIIFSNRIGNTGAIFGLHDAWPATGTFKLLMAQIGQQNYFLVDNGTYNKSLLDGDCHHVAITRAGSTLTFFIDGQIIGTRAIASTVNLDLSSTANLTIGYDFVSPNSFNGSISDIRIWSTARTPAQINNNMIAQLTGTEVNLEANWLMNEGVGQILNDNSINVNHAILGNNATIENIDPMWDTDCCLPYNPCPPIIINNDVPILDGIYQADQTVESAGRVPSTGNVHFKAGQNISLKSGFGVEAGATFSANIAPCDCNLPAPNNIIIDNADADDIYLSWNAVSGDISYYIEYVIDGGSTTYHYTNNTNIVIPFVVGLDHQYTVFTDCGETGSQGPTVGFTNSAECIDCDPAENVDVTFENDSLVISWDGADDASFINFAFYDDMGNLIFFTEEINTPGAPGSTIILPNDFPGGVFPDVFEVGVSVTCDIPQQRSTFEPENNIGCHELRIIIIVSDDEPWKYGDYCGMPAERPYKILCSHTNFSVTMAKFQCMHCNSNGVGWQNEIDVMDCKANCACK